MWYIDRVDIKQNVYVVIYRSELGQIKIEIKKTLEAMSQRLARLNK